MAYTPASNTTGTASLTHFATVYYKRTALDQLMKMFYFMGAGEPDVLPLRNGKTVQWFRYNLLSANTTPSAEGVVGTGIQMGTGTISATVSQYSDFATGSTLLQDTAIDSIAENFSEQLGYRAGLSVDTICRIELDTAATSTDLNPAGANLTSSDLRRAKALLNGADVRGKEGTDMLGIIHPYVLYDIMSDNTAGGFIDVMRYSQPDVAMTGEVGKIEGVRLVKSTNVKTSTDAAPGTLYTTYVVGKGAMGVVSLAGNAPSKVVDPQKQAFQVNIIQGKPQIADPEGNIGFAVSYRFVFVAKLLDTTTYRYKTIPADASII
jgi:N4-gp56 family major capsid protein